MCTLVLLHGFRSLVLIKSWRQIQSCRRLNRVDYEDDDGWSGGFTSHVLTIDRYDVCAWLRRIPIFVGSFGLHSTVGLSTSHTWYVWCFLSGTIQGLPRSSIWSTLFLRKTSILGKVPEILIESPPTGLQCAHVFWLAQNWGPFHAHMASWEIIDCRAEFLGRVEPRSHLVVLSSPGFAY